MNSDYEQIGERLRFRYLKISEKVGWTVKKINIK